MRNSNNTSRLAILRNIQQTTIVLFKTTRSGVWVQKSLHHNSREDCHFVHAKVVVLREVMNLRQRNEDKYKDFPSGFCLIVIDDYAKDGGNKLFTMMHYVL